MPAQGPLSARVRWHARWVVPVATPPIADGTVITEGDRIVWVGQRSDAPSGGSDEALGDCILTPGLVNAHTHLDLTVMRGFLEELSFFDWVRTLTHAKRAVLTDGDLRDAAMLGVAEGLAAGITTFGDTSDSIAPFDALRSLGARGIAFREVFGPDPSDAGTALTQLQAQVAIMRGRADSRVRVGVSPHAPYSVSDALFAAVAEWAARDALPVAVHIAESDDEEALVVRGAGPFAGHLAGRHVPVAPRAVRPVVLLEQTGLVRAGTLLIHCVHATAADIGRIADAGCGVAHCPASNAKLGHGVAPLTAFVAAGVRVGLGSDSMAANNTMDLLGEARLAVLQQRARTKRSDAIPARTAFRLATLGGAEALRLDDEIGTLAPGKQADLVAFAVDPLGEPALDPVAALIFGAGGVRAHRVIVAGDERVRDGVVHGFDPAVVGRVRQTAARLAEWRRAESAN